MTGTYFFKNNERVRPITIPIEWESGIYTSIMKWSLCILNYAPWLFFPEIWSLTQAIFGFTTSPLRDLNSDQPTLWMNFCAMGPLRDLNVCPPIENRFCWDGQCFVVLVPFENVALVIFWFFVPTCSRGGNLVLSRTSKHVMFDFQANSSVTNHLFVNSRSPLLGLRNPSSLLSCICRAS